MRESGNESDRAWMFVAGHRGLVRSEIVHRFAAGSGVVPRKLLELSRIHPLGWRHRIGSHEVVESTCAWFVDRVVTGAVRGV